MQSAEIRSSFRDALFRGPVFVKLDRLRRAHPELAPELDDLARALQELVDRAELDPPQR